MELIPTVIMAIFGAVFAAAGLIAGTGRVPGGVHAADSAQGGRRD